MLSRFALPVLAVLAMRSICHWLRLIGENMPTVADCASFQIGVVLGVSCCGLLPVIVPAGVVTVHVSNVAVMVACAVLLLILLALFSALLISLAGSVNGSGVAE